MTRSYDLLYATNVVLGQTVVVLTSRADFYGRCASHPALASALSAPQLLVGPMDDDELRRAIERPAQVADVATQPDQLSRRLGRVNARHAVGLCSRWTETDDKAGAIIVRTYMATNAAKTLIGAR